MRAAGTSWDLAPDDPDPFVRQELAETLYHVLWELVHVFFEHRGLLEGRAAGTAHDAGASAFLYPFLAEREDDLDAVLEDVRRSVLMKADEVAGLREATLAENAAALGAAAAGLRARLDAGGALLALGNGGSATDAQDAVADMRRPPERPAAAGGDRPGRRPGDHHRRRQRHRRRGGVRPAGHRVRRGPEMRCWPSRRAATRPNVIAALAEARRRGLHDRRDGGVRRRAGGWRRASPTRWW